MTWQSLVGKNIVNAVPKLKLKCQHYITAQTENLNNILLWQKRFWNKWYVLQPYICLGDLHHTMWCPPLDLKRQTCFLSLSAPHTIVNSCIGRYEGKSSQQKAKRTKNKTSNLLEITVLPHTLNEDETRIERECLINVCQNQLLLSFFVVLVLFQGLAIQFSLRTSFPGPAE